VPAAQLTQRVKAAAPVVVEYVPEGHHVHTDDPVVVEYVPALQLVQVVEEVAPCADEYVPTTHPMHTLDVAAPTTSEKVPAPQATQLDAPFSGPKVPTPHSAQLPAEDDPSAL
jgi:hypothetical protein